MVVKKNIYILLLFIVSFVSGQDYKKRLAVLENKASTFFFSNKDSTYFYYHKLYQLALKESDYINVIDNLNYVCVAAGYYFDTDKIKSTIATIDNLLEKHGKVLDTLADRGDYQKNYLNYNKGNYYHKMIDYPRAQFYFEEIISNLTKTDQYKDNPDDLSFLSTCYSFIASINAEQNRFEVADEYYQKNIRLHKEYLPAERESLDKVYNLYASSLYDQKEYGAAKKLFLQTLLYAEDNYTESKRNSIVTTSLMLSQTFKYLGKLDSAYYYLNKIEEYRTPEDPFNFRYITVEGDFLEAENKYDLARTAYLKALESAPKVNRPLIHKKVGDVFAKQKLWDLALENYQNGLIDLSSNFNSKSYLENPAPADVNQKQEFLRLLKSKSAMLSAKRTSADQLANVDLIETAISTIDLLKPSFKNDKDKAFLIENAYPLFESGIETTYNLHKSTKNDHYINEAFRYAEKSKSVLLLEALLSSQATQFADIPKEILERETQLKAEITRVEKKLVSSDNPDKLIKDNLFDLRQQHRKLVVDIETNYPAYFDLKYNNEVLSLAAIQQKLSNDELLVSYFYGNENIYAIAATKQKKYFEKLAIPPKFEGNIKKLHAMISNPKSNMDSLFNRSHSLYETLLAPIVNLYPQEKVIIIPDGLLNYVPFGSLVTNIEQKRYLVQDKAISYVNSATLWSRLNDKEPNENKLLAFAPSFNANIPSDDTRSEVLANLPHNKKEVAQILNSFKGDSFTDKKATLQNFTSSVSNHSIYHLATHAVFDDENPEYSYLAFTPNKDSEDLLFVKDLYNLSLNANMVTLSACESGIGELKRGEGFLSLARGFFYSGALSITSTLWKVNDASSSKLMNLYYINLAKGSTKDLALRNAKIEFLTQNRQNALAHPYYWSGFVVSGNTQNLVTKTTWLWFLIGSILVVGLGVFIHLKKTTRNS